jgi:predicted nucleic acid-binding protein
MSQALLVFVDAPVLLAAHDALVSPNLREAAQTWLRWCWTQQCGRISSQVLNNVYAQASTRMAAQSDGAGRERLRQLIRALRHWQPPHLDRYTVDGAWQLQDRYGLGYWDALLVASAQQQGCVAVLSPHLPHGHSYDGVLIAHPQQLSPDTLASALAVQAA